MKIYKNPIFLYGCLIFFILSNVGTFLYFAFRTSKCPICDDCMDIFSNHHSEEDEIQKKKLISVDVKGYVKKPGVYQVEEGTLVNDVIKLAGGLKSSGTTDDINLSKKVVDGTVIVVKEKSTLKSQKITTSKITTDSAYEIPTTTDVPINNEKENISTPIVEEEKKVSLNQATKEELMTLSGVGEKTAEKIIEYRMIQSFQTIEDIKKVSGIGEAIFEKIKDLITI